jgi:FMN phosphatase YigB (HAD superfamily)
MRAVLLDLFETLVSHFDPEWKPPCARPPSGSASIRRFYDEHWPRFAKQWETGAIAGYEPALAALCAAAGVRPDPRVLAELKRDYLRITSVAFVPPAPALVDTLSALRSRTRSGS